jgi:hypothetical protein
MHLGRKSMAAAAALALAVPVAVWSGNSASADPPRPSRVLIVLFDQMVPEYADQFDMVNFKSVRDSGKYFANAYLGYTASETVMAHNIITSGKLPKNMGWTDEAYRDADNLLGHGANEMYITGDLSLADFGTLIANKGYPKLADYLHRAQPDKKFIVVGEKSYAVETAAAPSGDIAVRMSDRSPSSLRDSCRATLGGRFRYPTGKNVPTYIGPTPGLPDPVTGPPAGYCNRYYINSDNSLDYGTHAAYPSWMYFEQGNRFFTGTDPSSVEHPGGDEWAADAAIAMMNQEPWSGMFVTLGGIDKAGHMWGAQKDAETFDKSKCTTGTPAEIGAAQTHVPCAVMSADAQFGRILANVRALDKRDGKQTMIVLTADHGATYGENFLGKKTIDAGDSNWYYAPQGVWDAGVFLPPTDLTYNVPSDPIKGLNVTLKENIQFSYQSTEIETWLVDRSEQKMKEAAAALLGLPGVTATFWHDGDHFKLYGENAMTDSERQWYKDHGQELVDSMAASNGPDAVALLHDKTSYGVYGDHGGGQESVQRVPIVFYSPTMSKAQVSGVPMRTLDIMPTILKAMGIEPRADMDGQAWTVND